MLARARLALLQIKSVNIKKASCIIDNKALLYTEQPDFLNQVIEIETSLSPYELLKELQKIEKNLGRKKRVRYGPREIDLDILSCEKICLNEKDLVLPHPALKTRPYLKQLLEDIKVNFKDLRV